MKRSGQKSEGSGKRLVTADEAELWQNATRSLVPIKAKPRVGRAAAPPQPSSPAAPPPARSPEPTPASHRAKPSPADASRAKLATARAGPPLAQFDRRKARQIASGKVEVDARIDLHGLYQREAYARLRAFLSDAHARGLKRVLVITGKGGAEPPDRLGELVGERRGVLRRSVPHWLEEPGLRSMVASFTQAGVRHGGAGALYVELRRSR
jgi:DNA-nicking Smr family endonuclease